LIPEDADLQDPRRRAEITSHTFVVLYLAGLVFLVTIQYLQSATDGIPVLQRLMPSQRFGLWEVAMGVGAGVLVVMVQTALRSRLPWLQTFKEMMFGMIGKPSLLQCFGIAVTSALAEEVLFRGMIQASTHILVACVLFGLAHYMMWQWAVFAGILGLVLGGLFEIPGGGLLAPVMAHFTINFLGLMDISKDCPEDAPAWQPEPPPGAEDTEPK